MGKKDKKDGSKKEAKKARQVAKQQKTAQKRTKKELKETGEKDIESILAEYSAKESRKMAVAITLVPQPSRRANFSMTTLPTGEMLMFGGEFFDGETTIVYNELFKWNVDRNEWRQIESLNTPPPRCSHQAVLYQDKVYVFGGEYGTLDQFYHYRDLWELDLKTNTWREVEATGDWPTARSGHRMVLWRNFIVLFGGFYEAMREVRWYNDLYFFSLQERKWIAVPPPRQNSAQPKPRSGHMMFLHSTEDVLYVYGGFAKEKTPGAKKEHIEHEDMWSMSLKPLVQAKGAAAITSTSALDWTKLSWQRVAKKGEYPTARCGAVAAVYKNKALVFGGVFDEEGPRHALLSSFYNDLFAFDMDRKRWYQLGLKQVKDKAKVAEERTAKKLQRKQAASAALLAARQAIAASNREEGTGCNDNDDDGNLPEINFRRVGYFEEEEEEEEDEEDEDEVVIDGSSGGRVAAATLRKDGELFGFIDDNGDVVYMQIEDEEGEEGVEGGVSEVTAALKDFAIAANDTAMPPLPPSAEGDDISHITSASTANIAPIVPVVVTASTSASTSHVSNSHITAARARKTAATAVGGLALRTPEDFARYFGAASEPCARIHACAVMRNASLVIYGGVTEANDVEITLDDCWALDINKRDVWRRLVHGSMHSMEWKGAEEDDQSRVTGGSRGDGDSDDDEEDDEDEDEDSDNGEDSDDSGSDTSSDDDDSEESELEGGEDSDEEADSDEEGAKKKKKKQKKDKSSSKKDKKSSKKEKKDKKDKEKEKKSSKKDKKDKDKSKKDRAVAEDDDEARDEANTEDKDAEDALAVGVASSKGSSRRHGGSSRHGGRRAEIDDLRDQLSLTDLQRTPLAGESLRDFYARTVEYWATEVVQRFEAEQAALRSGGINGSATGNEEITDKLSEKDIKRQGFALAGERYEALLPTLSQLNDLEAEQRADEDRHRGKEQHHKATSSKHKEKEKEKDHKHGHSGKGDAAGDGKKKKK